MSTDMSPTTGERPDWTKPGPGSWELDSSHYEADCSRIVQRFIEVGVIEGSTQGFEIMGGPIRGLEAKFVNGHFYRRLVPLIGAGRDLSPPPAPLLWLVTRMHPEFRRQSARAKASIQNRAWNDELHKWETEDKPRLSAACRSLAAQLPDTMDDDRLRAHLDELIELVQAGSTLHFRLHVSDLGPIGLLLVKSRDWGLNPVSVMATLSGHSPATVAPRAALSAIAKAARTAGGNGAGEDDGGQQFETLEQLRATSPEVSSLLDDFLMEYGWRLTTGYDLQELTLIELPELILSSINAQAGEAAADAPEAAEAVGEAAAAELQQQLSPVDRAEFDQLVSDARALYGLRDENGPLTYQWPAGLLRRAMLEAGRRLQDRGRIAEQQQVFDLSAEELLGVLEGAAEPTSATLAARMAERKMWKQQQAPPALGPVVDPPPPWTLPAPLALVMDMVTTVLELIESDGTAATLDGVGIGDQDYVGRARVVTDELDALTRMEPGDVLIAPFTVPTYNAALAAAGAVVVENGGLLCHAAVIAREYGIAGLVGVTGVTEQITDGAMVRVDPVAGSIRELTADQLSP